MPIPANIQRRHILTVMRQIDRGRVIPSKRHARKVACIDSDNSYPVKILISWGYEVATSQELCYSSFTTNEATSYLENLSFRINRIN